MPKTPKTDLGKRLAANFRDVSLSSITKIEQAIKTATNPRRVSDALDLANELLEGYGVKAVRGKWFDRHYDDVVLLYIDHGDDVFNFTLCYDTTKGQFFAGTAGSWIMRHKHEFGITKSYL